LKNPDRKSPFGNRKCYEVPLSKKNSGKKSGKPKPAAASNSPINMDLLEQVVRLMNANDLNTIEVRDGNRRVVLKRGSVAAPNASSGSTPVQYSSPTIIQNPGTPNAPADDTAGLLPIKSPMVGTFYSAASPDAKAFVSVGSTVDEETDVCIIEAMKVFNNIKAETRGTIAKILVSNGQTVEYGQTLFLVKP
jgi:acetyl-CoA carboxylase biotin carboxyl carrier protein